MFYIAKLSTEAIANGILFRITDALGKAFDESIRPILVDHKQGDSEELLIYFDNSSTDLNFHDKYEGYLDVLYLNEAAKEVIERAGVVTEFDETTIEVPKTAGLMNKTCRYINIR